MSSAFGNFGIRHSCHDVVLQPWQVEVSPVALGMARRASLQRLFIVSRSDCFASCCCLAGVARRHLQLGLLLTCSAGLHVEILQSLRQGHHLM